MFSADEYERRIERTRAAMAARGIDSLLVFDPASLCYLTGYSACSFYTPQALLLPTIGDPTFFCREMDAPAARETTYLTDVEGYPEDLVQQRSTHPTTWIAERIRARLDGQPTLAVEVDSEYHSVRAHRALVDGLSTAATLTDAEKLVNWVRTVKTPAEIEVMRTAGRITERMFDAAIGAITPEARECDVVADIYAAGIRGTEGAAGDYPAIPPLVLSGPRTAFPHLGWSERTFEAGQATTLELAGCHRRYHAPTTRTLVFSGVPSTKLKNVAQITGDGLEAALAALRVGAQCQDVEAAWRRVVAPHGLRKHSRIGYPVGIGFPPDWGEGTLSLRAGDTTVLEPNMTIHVMIGMWLDGWGYSISELVRVTDSGPECLTSIPRGLTLSTS